jgi:hypothetical protein
MRASYIILAIALAGACTGTALAWGDDTIEVGNPTVPYKITSDNGSERGVVKYHIYLTRHIHESGEPSTMFHPADDRQCDWSMEGHMDRVVCITSIMGVTSCNNNLSKNLPLNISGQSGAPSNWLDHRPCSDFIGQINAQTEQLKSSMNTQILIQSDLNGDLKQTLQGSGVNVTYGSVAA